MEGCATTRGRARDNACRGDDGGVQQRVDGCDDTQQKGARGGARGVVMHPKMTSREIPTVGFI